jgi:hypothetical protein
MIIFRIFYYSKEWAKTLRSLIVFIWLYGWIKCKIALYMFSRSLIWLWSSFFTEGLLFVPYVGWMMQSLLSHPIAFELNQLFHHHFCSLCRFIKSHKHHKRHKLNKKLLKVIQYSVYIELVTVLFMNYWS